MTAIGLVRKKHRGHGPLLGPVELAHKLRIYAQCLLPAGISYSTTV